MGLEAAGFDIAWQVEIDKDAVSVLERHYPNIRRYHDVREVKGADLEPVDVLIGGFPCQDLSVAGTRKGLAGERSGLFFEVARIAAETTTPWLLLENVDGLLSSWISDNPPPSDLERGREWVAHETSSLGIVLSTLHELGYLGGYRVLDAQHFGVAQRRKRVFIVGHLGGTGARAAEVLLEPESVLWDLAACLEARQGTPGVPESGAGSSDVACDIADTLSVGANQTTGFVGDVIAHALAAHGGSHGRIDAESETCIVASSLTAGGHPNSTMPGRHREDDANLVVVGTLAASGAGSARLAGNANETDMLIPVAAWDERNVTSAANRSRCEPGLPANTLHANGMSVAFGQSGGLPGQGYPAVAFTNRGRAVAGAHETLRAASHGALPMVADAAVRRLMPVECETLQGWPRDWTRYRADGSEIADGPRYRMIGNGVVKNVALWIGRRLRHAMEATP